MASPLNARLGGTIEPAEWRLRRRFGALGEISPERLRRSRREAIPVDQALRICRSGDCERLTPDSLLVAIGRNDRMVKVGRSGKTKRAAVLPLPRGGRLDTRAPLSC